MRILKTTHQRRKNVQANSLVEESARRSKQRGKSVRKKLRMLWYLEAADARPSSPESAARKQ
jgi:hypothetical protein